MFLENYLAVLLRNYAVLLFTFLTFCQIYRKKHAFKRRATHKQRLTYKFHKKNTNNINRLFTASQNISCF